MLIDVSRILPAQLSIGSSVERNRSCSCNTTVKCSFRTCRRLLILLVNTYSSRPRNEYSFSSQGMPLSRCDRNINRVNCRSLSKAARSSLCSKQSSVNWEQGGESHVRKLGCRGTQLSHENNRDEDFPIRESREEKVSFKQLPLFR